ncbi:MAG: ferredoxin--NADP reductase [Magnetococcus sp. DMHC-1]|nr:ferredoxin--NADP reductase [Magnetococcales bacterium]MBF0155017.1 ferredoxin--NADP reductase [Magnetococcales bacterium]
MTATPDNATLIQRLDISPRLIILRIRPDFPISFVPGQFTVLGLRQAAPRVADADPETVPPEKADRLIRRAYSISSGSHETDYLEFYIALVTGGQLTPRLFALKTGDRLFVGPKATGMFTLDRVPPGQNILLVATGTGLAPYLSMVRTLAMATRCPAMPLAILHGASHSWDLGYRADLEALSQKCPTVRYAPVVSRPQEETGWQGRTGRLTEWFTPERLQEISGFAPDPAHTHIFLCGHPDLVEDGMQTFQAWGFDPGSRKEPGNLHVEKYW